MNKISTEQSRTVMHIPCGPIYSRELREPLVRNLPCGNTVNLLKVNTNLMIDADAWVRYPELTQVEITNNDLVAAAEIQEPVIANQFLIYIDKLPRFTLLVPPKNPQHPQLRVL